MSLQIYYNLRLYELKFTVHLINQFTVKTREILISHLILP